MDVVDITILGSKKQIENKVAELGIAFDFSKGKLLVRLNLSIIDYVNTYYELRKKM
jgi:phosphate acetyltransferase